MTQTSVSLICLHKPIIVSCFSTQTGSTALHIASQNGHSDVVKILLANGADMNIVGFMVIIFHHNC